MASPLDTVAGTLVLAAFPTVTVALQHWISVGPAYVTCGLHACTRWIVCVDYSVVMSPGSSFLVVASFCSGENFFLKKNSYGT